MNTHWSVNITPVERVGRNLVGTFGAIGGWFLLGSASSTVAVALEILLILTGLDLVVTGALGHCPLYKKLGFVPTSLKERTP